MPHRNYEQHMDNGWGLVMLLGMVTLWVVIAILIYWLVRQARERPVPPAPPAASSAEQILAERLARGEIDAAEYRERLDALAHRPGT